jgi:hypothetical protein
MGILYEEWMQNLLTYSNNFIDVSWQKTTYYLQSLGDGVNLSTKLIDNSNK